MPNTESSSRFLESLAQISRAIMGKDYVEDVLALIVSVTAKVTGSKICSILLLDREKKELVLRACQSDSGRYGQKSNTPLGQGIAGRVALSNKSIKVLDVREDPRFLNKEIARNDGLVSLLSVPMSVGGEVIGVLNCYTPHEYDFTHEDIEMLTAVASQAAVVLKNTELQAMKDVIERELRDRKNIERAKEMLMERKGISDAAARELMRKHSLETGTPIPKIAEAIILASSLD